MKALVLVSENKLLYKDVHDPQINPMEHYIQLQIQDFLQAIIDDRDPLVTGEDSRKTVELFTAIYRSQRDSKPVKSPLEPENDRDEFDGRLSVK